MKRYIHASETHTSGCSFDFDLGDNYDGKRIEDKIYDLFADMDLDVLGVDFRAVDYPKGKVYSQCGIDFEWSDYYNQPEIEEALANMIDDEGGNFFGIDFYSLED